MFKKVLSAALAMSMALAMFTTAMAASGYDLSKVDKVTGTAVAEVTEEAVNKAVANKQSVVYVPFYNANEVTPDAFKKVAEEAAKKNIQAKVMADTVMNNVVVGRVIIDAKVAAAQGKDVQLKVTVGDKATKDLFSKYFVNEIAVVSLSQPVSFGQVVEIAAKVDLSKLDSSKPWHFYSYDAAKNEYREIAGTNYKIDANGYIHFNTQLAGKILITDKPMTSK